MPCPRCNETARDIARAQELLADCRRQLESARRALGEFARETQHNIQVLDASVSDADQEFFNFLSEWQVLARDALRNAR